MSSVQITQGDIVITQLPYHAGYSVGRVTKPGGPAEQRVPLGVTATESAAVERARGMAAGRRVWLQIEDGGYAERT